MEIRLIQVPYDSGHRGRRMGAGPLRLAEVGTFDRLEAIAATSVDAIELSTPFLTEIGSAFDLHRAIAGSVNRACESSALPLVLSGNCNASLGTVAGLQRAGLGEGFGVVWFDGHGDSNTPETFTGTFLDAMGLSTLTGRCWQGLAATVPGFNPVADEAVLLVGGHGADSGARDVLEASRIGWVLPNALRGQEGNGLEAALDRLARRGVNHLYLHLDVDVIDAGYARGNEFAPTGGLLPEELVRCVDTILSRFEVVAAGVASYDPSLDDGASIRDLAVSFLEDVARARLEPS